MAQETDHQSDATARQLVVQYGDDAEVIATLRAAEFAAAGDRDGLAHWDAIIIRVAQILNAGGAPVDSSLN